MNKKRNIKIIFGLLLLFMVKTVYGSTLPDLYVVNNNDRVQGLTWRYNFHDTEQKEHYVAENYYKYSFRTSTNGTYDRYTAYCLDPGASSGIKEDDNDNVKETVYSCDRVLGEESLGNDETTYEFEAGSIEILENGYNEDKTSITVGGKTLSGNDAYYATSIALRVFQSYWPNNKINSSKAMYLFAYLREEWLSKLKADGYIQQVISNLNFPDVMETYAKVLNACYADDSCTLTLYDKESGSNQTRKVKENILDVAYLLVEKGFKAAAEYKSGAGRASITLADKGKNDIKNGEILIGQSKNYLLEVKNFTSSTAYINLKFNCPECEKKGIKYEIFINGTSYGKNFPDDLLKVNGLLNNGTGNLNIKINFTKDELNEDCDFIEFTLEVYYNDASLALQYLSCYVKDNSDCKNGKCQRFYVINSKGKPKELKEEDSLNLCGLGDCNTLKKQCDLNPNSSACDRYERECKKCTTYVGNSYCTNVDSEFDILEGYEGEEVSCERPTVEDIKNCVINSEDINGISYKNTDSNLPDNDYCSIWCKEDFHFKMPGIKYTTSIRFIDLRVGIEGTKTCYTTNINKAKFEVDVNSASKDLIDSYNEYQLYHTNSYSSSSFSYSDASFDSHYEFTEHNTNISYTRWDCDETSKTCTSSEGIHCDYSRYGRSRCVEDYRTYNASSWSCNDSTKICSQGNISCGFNDSDSKEDCRVSTPPKTVEPDSASGGIGYRGSLSFSILKMADETYQTALNRLISNINRGELSCSVSSNGVVSCNYNSSGSSARCYHFSSGGCYCLSGSNGTSLNTFLSNGKSSSEVKLNQKISALNTVVGRYKKCTNWTMDYDFNPIVKYDYEETYMNNMHNNIFEAEGEVNISDPITRECPYETDDSYSECKDSRGNNSWGNISSFEVSIPDCTISGISYNCSLKRESFSNTINRKQTITANGNYVVPSQYLNVGPTGGIVLDGGSGVENGKVLENSLPIGGTTQGYYKFALLVENLGEYYKDNDELGRVWGSDRSIFKTTLNNTESCRVNSAIQNNESISDRNYNNGLYVCKYAVNIPGPDNPNPECPDCPVVCVQGSCYYDDPKCPHCPVTCPNCLYNGGLNVENRPITPDNVNPNDRDLGANWNSGIDPDNPDTRVNITTSRQLKAYATTREIQKDGNSVYDVDFNDTTVNNTAMEITLDSQMISWIKSYNNNHINDGGYANNTLKCYDYNAPDGKTYKNVYCYSTFIDEILYNSSLKNKIKVKGVRIIGANENDTNNLRKGSSNQGGYWTLWDRSNTDNSSRTYDWQITTVNSIEYYTTKYGYNSEIKVDYGIGPSWK